MAITDWRTGLAPELDDFAERIRTLALSYPETVEEFPWGHPAVKVRGKTFLFMGSEGAALGFSVKLPRSHPFALDLPFAAPTGYGLGRAHWISFRVKDPAELAPGQVAHWLDESYRANAPKALLKRLDGEQASLPVL